MNKPVYVYLCDKKQGACKSWEKYGWKECSSEVGCNHTTNPEHALCNGCYDNYNDSLIIKCWYCPERKESQDDRE